MTTINCNCIVCANEFEPDQMESVALSKINITAFKICNNCIDQCDPADNYRQARDIVNSYLKFSETKNFSDVLSILNELKS